MLQIYTSDEFFQGFHANFPVTQSHMSNGMRTRMSALHYALQLPVITDIAEATGDLLIEPFAVKPRVAERKTIENEDKTSDKWKEIETRYAEQICNYRRGRKFLICSEMEIIRWRGELRKKVLSTMTNVFTTCDYQENLLSALGITSYRLPEPINNHLFYPSEKRPKQIVASGIPRHVKNIEGIIDLYRALEGKGYHRIYVGGPNLWGGLNYQIYETSFKYDMARFAELKDVCDEYYDSSPSTKVARIFAESEFYVNLAYHEVGCRSVLEALMSGCGIIWGNHPLGKELPVLCMAKDIPQAVNALDEFTGTVDAETTRNFALHHHSYVSVRKQLERCIYGN